MEEAFELPVEYKGQDLTFHAKLLPMGYVYKFEIDKYGTAILFEKDDQGKYRALLDPAKHNDAIQIDIDLLMAITSSLEAI